MPGVPEWEFTYRWADISLVGLTLGVEFLEAKDQALEKKLRDGYGGSCQVNFEYPYRWDQILDRDLATQISMLEMRDSALESAINGVGGCTVELPFRWTQILPGMLENETYSYMLAEENDRVLESRFGGCSCATGITTFADFSFDGGISEEYFFPFDGTLSDFHIEALGVSANTAWRINIFNSGFSLLARFIVTMPTGGNIDAILDLNDLSITGTYPGDTVTSSTGTGDPAVVAGSYFQFDVTSSSFTATPNPFQLTAQFMGEEATLTWFNPS
jgi:hypothetical protein